MTPEWTALKSHHQSIANRPILSLFSDAGRFDDFSARCDGMLLDYSKTQIDGKARDLLISLARARRIEAARDAMFSGARINSTENRAALHTALRDQGSDPIVLDGRDVLPEIRKTRARMADFSDAIRNGTTRSATGHKFTDVVNIGIGGSDLGPKMAVRALAPYHDGPRMHFVSNVDPADISDTLAGLDGTTTLIVIASKTFTTIETMSNAKTAIRWLQKAFGANREDAVAKHLVAVSSAVDKAATLGIPRARVFGFEDWVGGRYSVWGPVGLPLMLAIGPQNFQDFLSGGYAMDRHFQTAPLGQNLPVLLGLTGIWHNNICGHGTRAILPYDQRLSHLPAYFQQLDMESNGKSVTQTGTPVDHATGPIVWGAPGTNGQHAFYQLLHQGTRVVPAEFLIAATGHEADLSHQHRMLQANCLAQSEALMCGRNVDKAREIAATLGYHGDERNRQAAHRTFPGNRPSITIVYPCLTPFTLGQIIALYEHRVFTEAVIWGINPFDQWGVELGKTLATEVLPMIEGSAPSNGKDASTRGLIAALTDSSQ